MNLHYELIITDLDMPDDNVIVHVRSDNIKHIEHALIGHEEELSAMMSGRSENE